VQKLSFVRLNEGWNAEPNAPHPHVTASGRDILLEFFLNPFQFPQFDPDDCGTIRFLACSRYRLGGTNDEGWYRGQCRYSKVAPAWGEFYEVIGTDIRLNEPQDWQTSSRNFKCFAAFPFLLSRRQLRMHRHRLEI
jgi:hypothetical protein